MCVPYRVTTTLSLSGCHGFNNERKKMSTYGLTGSESNERAYQNQFFVVRRGETLGSAVIRHRRDHGAGPLLLMRDFNRAPVGRQGRSQAVA